MFVLVGLSLLIAFPGDEIKKLPYKDGKMTVSLRRLAGTNVPFFQSKMSCCVDGAPKAYHRFDDRSALDDIRAAGGKREGNKPNGKLTKLPSKDIVVYVDGKLFVQASGALKDFLVCQTAYQSGPFSATDPRRYVDATTVQYVVLPGGSQIPGVKTGDLAALYDPVKQTIAFAVSGEVGPRDETGEASIAAIRKLGYELVDGRSSPGQSRRDLLYIFFPGTAAKLRRESPWPLDQKVIDKLAEAEFKAWGGYAQVKKVLGR